MARARENRQAARTKPEITIEAGVADLNDSVLKSRIDGLKAIHDQAKTNAERAQVMLENSGEKADVEGP